MSSSRPISGPSKVVLQEKETEIHQLCADISSVSRWNAPAPSQHPIPLRAPRPSSRFRDHLSTLRYQLQCRQNLVSLPFHLPLLSSPPHHLPPSLESSNLQNRDISWSLIQNPSLWAFALSQGRDGIAFLQAFRAMRRGYANGSFRYAVMVFGRA